MAAGYKDFTASSVLAAADLEDYCENQSIMRFASAAARDTALSAVKTEGMCAYLVDVNTVTVYSGSAWSTVGPVHGALTAWTPAVVQSGAVTTTNNQSWYQRIGRLIIGGWFVTVTGSGTGSNVITVSAPFAMASLIDIVGTAYISDTSAGLLYPSLLVAASSTTFKMMASSGVNSLANLTQGSGSVAMTAALANTDTISGSFAYMAAADA